jgi:LPXTG-motif cell wall-anchored protein
MLDYMKTLPAVTNLAPPQYPGKADDPEGKKLIFQKRCVACHGENGPVVQFQSTGRTPTTALVLQQLRTPKNNMPTFNTSWVSDAEAGLIADFLAAQVKAATPAPAALPKTGDALNLASLVALGLGLAAGGYALRRRA